jgi:hypothetical protein
MKNGQAVVAFMTDAAPGLSQMGKAIPERPHRIDSPA